MGRVSGIKIGYARVSTIQQDLTAQREALAALGVHADRFYVDHGLTGTTRERPGLREALAAVRTGDTLVVAKLDRLARSVADARDILAELTTRGVALQICASIHDPTDPVGRLLFNALAMVAEFEADLIRARTREGMAVARAAGKLRGRKPTLSPAREALLVDLHRRGHKNPSQLAELFSVGHSTVYRALQRAASAALTAAPPAPAGEVANGGAGDVETTTVPPSLPAASSPASPSQREPVLTTTRSQAAAVPAAVFSAR